VLGALFAIDLACKRGDDADWQRNIEAWIPVRDVSLWKGLAQQVAGVFSGLTYDPFRVTFVESSGMSAPPRTSRRPFPDVDTVALLSGGVDSFVGAVALLEAGMRPLFVSHKNSPSASDAIGAVTEALRARGAPANPDTLTARKRGRETGRENSQRTRSLLYVGLACLVADGLGLSEVWINENGVMAVHAPLTVARAGSFSTRTANPRVMREIERLASDALGRPIAVNNRLVAMTKPEVAELADRLGVASTLPRTVSCWQIGRSPEHCGRCVPCIMRRISHEYASVPDCTYATNPLDDVPSGESWATVANDNLFHMLMQAVEIDGAADESDLMLEYPEVLNSGRGLSVAQSVDMHKRWATQCLTVARSHPYSLSILEGRRP
jgi:hypothetical protein